MAYRGPENEIVVFIKSEIIVCIGKCTFERININMLSGQIYNLRLRRGEATKKGQYGKQQH